MSWTGSGREAPEAEPTPRFVCGAAHSDGASWLGRMKDVHGTKLECASASQGVARDSVVPKLSKARMGGRALDLLG